MRMVNGVVANFFPYGPIEILPGARALHFAEQAFEGMKAYRIGRPVANLFRAGDNYARFKVRRADRDDARARGAVPRGIRAVVSACTPFVPDKSGQSLYVRPFLLELNPAMPCALRTLRAMVIGNPSEAYAAGAMKVLIEREQVRRPWRCGSVKTGANYAASLLATTRAHRTGIHRCAVAGPDLPQSIRGAFGDEPVRGHRRRIAYPGLNDSILPGVTRDSLVRLARDLGWRVVERTCPSPPA